MFYSIDIGNGYSVISDGLDTIHSVQTIYAPVIGRRQIVTDKHLLEFRGTKYSIGEAARHYPYPSLVSDKIKYSPLFVLTLLQLVEPQPTYDLVVTVPNVEQHANAIAAELNGKHNYIYNNTPMTTTINVRQVMNEGFGSFHLARHEGRLPHDGYTLVLDIGSGTTVALVIDNETGAILECVSENLSGVSALVTDIQGDEQFRRDCGGDAIDPTLILRGITNRSFNYGSTRINFESIYEEYLKHWFKRILDKALRQFHARKATISAYLITGGGSLLIRDKLKGKERFVLANNPLTDNCFGIAHYVRESGKNPS